MGHIAGQIFFIVVYGFFVLIGLLLSYNVPLQIREGICSASVRVNGKLFERSRTPVRYWAAFLVFNGFLLYLALTIDYCLILKPLWELVSKP